MAGARSRPEALINAALTLFREQAFYYTLTPPLLGITASTIFCSALARGFVSITPARLYF